MGDECILLPVMCRGWAFTHSSPFIGFLNDFGENGIVTWVLFITGLSAFHARTPPRLFLFKVCGTSFGKFFPSGGGDVS